MLVPNNSYRFNAKFEKFDLMSALFHGASGEQKKLVIDLQIKGLVPKDRLEVTVLSVTREDGSGQSWIIYGFISWGNSGEIQLGTTYIDMYCDTRSKTGTFKVLKEAGIPKIS
jgi:hypothetical protein